MTHPKQLENVARAIQDKLESLPFAGKGTEGDQYLALAQAAIEAAFKPLDIRDAPKDKPALVVGKPQEEILDKTPHNEQTLVCKLYGKKWCAVYSGDMTFIMRDIKGYIPIPTQEGE